MRPLTLDEWKDYNTPLPSGSRAKQKRKQPRTRAERQAMIEEIRAECGLPCDLVRAVHCRLCGRKKSK